MICVPLSSSPSAQRRGKPSRGKAKGLKADLPRPSPRAPPGMAAAGAAFSIREYAARARARAEGGTWPFGGDAGALPPVEVRRFLWWQDEAAAVEEEEEVEVERRMAAKRRKRSVAELFAAVPRVPRSGGQASAKGKKAAKRKAEKDKGKLVLAVTVKTKRKKKVPVGVDVREKEKNSGIKVTSISISKSFQHSIKKELKNSSCKKKEKQEVSVLLDKKSKKGNRKSVLEKHKKDMANSVEAQSICKNQSKAGFITVLNTTDLRCKSNSSFKSKHVTLFDGTVKFRRTAHLPEENTKQPQSVQTFHQPTQEGRDHHNTDEQQSVYQQAEAISGPVETTSSLSENLVPAGVCHTIPLTKPKDITILGNSVDLNHCIETSHGSNCLNSTSLACLSSKVPCQNFKGVDSHLNGGNSLSVDVECLGEQNHMLSQASFNPVSLASKVIPGDRSPLSEPSGSCLYDRSRSTIQERAVAFGKVSSELLRSGNMVRSISSSTGSNKPAQAADCISACRNNHNRDDYVGLPINSRGEFVKVHPGGTPNSVDSFKRQCLGENSLCPSASPTVFSPITCTDHVNLRPRYHARQICAIDQSVFHADPRFTPTAPMAYGTDVRQLPSSERTKIHYYTIPSNKYPCTKQQELSMECFSSECLEHHNPQQKLLGTRNHCLSHNFGQDTQHNAETTVRLMGKTVTLGNSSIQCPRLNNETPCSSKQSQAEDQFFQGTHTKVFPQLFHGGLVYPPSALRISDGERQPSGNPSHFSFLPAAVRAFVPGTSSFRTSGHNQQPELATASNPYVQPVDWRNKSELGNQQPVMANQVQSNAEDMLLGSIHCRHTQTVAPESSFNTRSSTRNFMGKGPASYQSSYLTQQQFSNMAPRTVASSFASGYAVQKTPGLTTQKKFTSLRPLPPSVVPSHVYSTDYAPPPHRPVTTFHASVPIPYLASNSSAPMMGIESMRWTMMGSKPEGLEHLRNYKRPAEKDDVPLALPKKPCTAAQKGLHMLPFAETGLEFRGSRPDAQPSGTAGTPICLDDEAEADLRLGNREIESYPTWSKAVSTMRPVKLKPGAKHGLQPSASSVYQENPWPTHSITPPLAPGE